MQDKEIIDAPRILLVEDNKDQAFVLSYYLQNNGYIVDWCNSPQSAIKTAYQNDYNVILLDVNLNANKDGFGLCQEIKSDPGLQQIPVIMVTARTAKRDRVNGLRLGADDYITKPFSREEVMARIEAAIRRNQIIDYNKKYQELLENTNDIVLFINPHGEVEHSNKQAKLVFADLNSPGKPLQFHELFDGLLSFSITTIVKRVLDGNEVSGSSWRLKETNLKHMNVDAKLLPLHDRNKIVGIGAILKDTTARENVVNALEKNTQELKRKVQDTSEQLNEMQQKLILSEKMAVVGQLAAGIAHELRNPLNTINSSVYFLTKVIKTPNIKIAEHLDIIKEEISRSQTIVDNLLTFSKKSADAKSQVDINSIIEQSIALVHKELLTNNILFEQDLTLVQKCYVNADELKQVFLNLILNAKNAMPSGGTLKVTTKMADNEYVETQFSDTGIGIPPENLNKIFDPFFTTDKKGKGTGIGLSIVHSAIKRNNGSIIVKSVEGEGTTFYIRLPIYDDSFEG